MPIPNNKTRNYVGRLPKTRWWIRKGENYGLFINYLKQEIGPQKKIVMRNDMSNIIKSVVKDILGESKGYRLQAKESHYWMRRYKKELRINKHILKPGKKITTIFFFKI